MIRARHDCGEVFVQLAPPIEGPWDIGLCKRLIALWEPRGGSWAVDAQALQAAVTEAEAYQNEAVEA